LALLASASYQEGRGQCDTGSISCCQQVQTTDQATNVLTECGLLDVAAGIVGLVGVDCTSVLGTGCDAQQQPVCCTHNNFNGVVNLGCSPINLAA
ncbi:hydrophobin, partial [Melanogaster broomeanus]